MRRASGVLAEEVSELAVEGSATSRRGARSPDMRGGGPTVRQERILAAYARRPNAAAVARELGTNERHVRRLVDRFAERLSEIRHEMEDDRREQLRMREQVLLEWVQRSLETDLSRLDTLTSSADDGVALRALKLKFELSMRLPDMVARLTTEFDGELVRLERQLAERIKNLDVELDSEGGGSA
jgi:hypothetical protein